MNYQYLTIFQKDIPTHQKQLANFFINISGYKEGYSKSIENSSFICTCLDGNEIIGAFRVITDYNRFAFLVDLNVAKDYQRQGIGTQLVKNVVQECIAKKIQYIETSTDPNFPWLEGFYTKIGFSKMIDSVAMEYINK